MAFKVFKAHNWRNANENRKLPPAPACCFHGFVSDPIIQFPPGNWLILVKSSRKRPYSEKIPLNTNESCFSAIYWGKLQDTATITNLNQASLDWSTHTFTLISRDVLERSFEFIQISLLQRYQTSSLSLSQEISSQAEGELKPHRFHDIFHGQSESTKSNSINAIQGHPNFSLQKTTQSSSTGPASSNAWPTSDSTLCRRFSAQWSQRRNKVSMA